MSRQRRIHPKNSKKTNGLVDDLPLPQNSRLVELLISCRDLRNETDKNSVDTFCVLSKRKFGQWKEYDRTEIIRHTSSPSYCRSFSIEHHVDVYDEKCRLEVYMLNTSSNYLTDQTLFGMVEVDFSEIIDATSTIHTSSFPLMLSGAPKPQGHLWITAEVIKPTRSKVIFHCGGKRLKRKGVLGSSKKPHTFLEIARSIDAIEYHPIFRTPVSWDSSEPRWKPFEISLEKLCNSDENRNIRLSVNHHSKEGAVLIGELETNLQKLKAVVNSKSRVLLLRKSISSQVKDSMKEKGHLSIYDLILEHQYTFLDFVRGGCQCRIYVGIDFTLSNGFNEIENSFHGNKGDNEVDNIYQPAIQSVLNVFTPYTRNWPISAYGFGAKIYRSDTVNHCFPINPLDEDIITTEDLLEQYFKILPHLKFAGPTYLTPILEEVSRKLASDRTSQYIQNYSFLFVFTDGVLNDIENFQKKLEELKDLPLSVMIIGVGPMDLEALECFDSRNKLSSDLEMHKQSDQARQNSHFFHHKSCSVGANKMVSEGFTTLAAQMVHFMKWKGITPNPPVQQQLNGSAKIYEVSELRASIKRRMEQVKPPSSSQLSLMNCPTCGHAISESTAL